MRQLNGNRLEQLLLLREHGAISRETAVCISMGGGFRHVLLSRMASEGLVEQAQLPYKGDSKRRLSHYWLTGEGRAALP